MFKNYKGAIWFIEDFLCYYNTIAMCYESYHSQKFEDLFENEFVEFVDFNNKFYNITNGLSEEELEFSIRSMLHIKREIPLKKYLKSLEKILNDLKIDKDTVLDDYISKTKDFKISDTPNGDLAIQMGLPIFVLNKIREVEEL